MLKKTKQFTYPKNSSVSTQSHNKVNFHMQKQHFLVFANPDNNNNETETNFKQMQENTPCSKFFNHRKFHSLPSCQVCTKL